LPFLCLALSAAAAVVVENFGMKFLEETEEEGLDPLQENAREAFVLPLHHYRSAPPSQVLHRWESPFAALPSLFLFLLLVPRNSIGVTRVRMT